MTENRGEEETAEELTHGQVVIVTARWILILAAWVLALWQPVEIDVWKLQIQFLLLIAYSIGNFFLTVQLLRRSEALPSVVYGTMLADLGLITILVLVLGGYESGVYVFYFPALLALSVTFSRRITVLYTLAAMVVYYLIVSADAVGTVGLTTAVFQNIVTRLILMAAVAFCGSMYRGLEADRRLGRGRLYQLFKAGGSAAPPPGGGRPQAPRPGGSRS